MSRRALKVQYRWAGNKEVPKIQITGEWLVKHGFEIGGAVTLEARAGEMILRAARSSDPDIR